MAQEFVQESTLPESPASKLPAHDDFDGETLQIGYYAPRIDPSGFVDLTSDRDGRDFGDRNPDAP